MGKIREGRYSPNTTGTFFLPSFRLASEKAKLGHSDIRSTLSAILTPRVYFGHVVHDCTSAFTDSDILHHAAMGEAES